MTRTFGIAPDQAYADMLGAMGFTADQMMRAGAAYDPLAGTGAAGQNNLSVTMGALQDAATDAREAIQSTFITGLDRMSGEEGALTRFAEMTSGAAVGVEAFADAVFAALDNDFEGAARALGVQIGGSSATPVAPGTQGNTESGDNPLEAIDPNYIPMAKGGIISGPDDGFPAELHGTEAVVPLPDGRSIPVSLESNSNQNNTDLVNSLANEIDVNLGKYTKAVEGLSFDTLANEIDINMGKYTNKAFEGLSFESLSSELTQLAATMQAANSIDEEPQSITVQDFGTSLDNSRTLSEMLQVNKNMLSQMITNVQKTDQIIRAMENANIISRNTAYVRA